MSDRIRIFVAATPSEWLPMRVLEFSIHESTVLPVEVTALSLFKRPIPVPKAEKNRPRTPFSFQRFLIPELCGYQGKAIYLDSDMQVFQDIAQLWNQSLGECDLQTVREGENERPRQFSVMLLDCARLSWKIEDIVAALDSGELDYEGLLYEMCVAKKIGRDIPSEWNSLEHYDSETTALLHYTDMHRQPWVSLVNPLGNLWISCLRRALAKGFIAQTELEREVAAGNVRPSLLIEVERGREQMVDLPGSLRQVDRGFVAPYKHLHLGRTRILTSIRRLLGGVIRLIFSPCVLSKIFHKNDQETPGF
jgi:hypothetical protein